jgi:hypothetical protein
MYGACRERYSATAYSLGRSGALHFDTQGAAIFDYHTARIDGGSNREI